MLIGRMRVENFRNYDEETVVWDEGINLIHGLNAQGKSNLLEAIGFLSLASSFRGATNQELLHWGRPYFYLEGEVISDKRGKTKLSAAMSKDKLYRWKIDDQPVKRAGQFVGVLHTVTFSPEDVLLIRSGPAARRRYLNRQMSQLYGDYCLKLLQYNHILSQRNQLLKNISLHKVDRSSGEDQLAVWNEQLISSGAEIIIRRYKTVKMLLPLAAELHARLSGNESLSFFYQGLLSKGESEEQPDAEEVKGLFAKELIRLHEAELIRGVTLCGPHRDELLISIDGNLAKNSASQGQQRTAALALKLAEMELGRLIRGEYPVLLLDDVLSELDNYRRQGVLQLMTEKTQTFITATDLEYPLKPVCPWLIKQGRIVK